MYSTIRQIHIADTRHDKIIESTHLTVPTSHLRYAYIMNVAVPDALCHDKVRHALYIMHCVYVMHGN